MTSTEEERRRALEELLSLGFPVGEPAQMKRESVLEPGHERLTDPARGSE